MRLYADSAKCCGCRACLVACSLNLFQESNPKKGALAIWGRFPEPGIYEVKVCTQCGKCAAVCPTEAIKLYREWTGAGLKEAKDQVEALETSLRAKAPARFGPATKRGGCLGSAALLTLCAVLVICWIVRN